MKRPKVFIIQETLKRNPSTGQMEPHMNFSPAAVYGELDVLLPRGMTMLTPSPVVHELKRKLAYITSDDYLILVGDPAIIGVTTAIALQNTGGRLNVLRWDRDTRSYIKLTLEV